MMLAVVVSLSLLWSLVEVHSQTFPYVSFMGQTLANHSYVDLSLVGLSKNGGDSVQCHTDLTTAAVVVRVSIVVTGTSLMEPGYHLVLQLFMRVVKWKELTSVIGVQPHQQAYITVTLQQLLSMIMKPLSQLYIKHIKLQGVLVQKAFSAQLPTKSHSLISALK